MKKHLKRISILFGSIPLQGYSPRRPPDFEKCRQVKVSNYAASEARLRRNDNKLTTILPIITKNDKGL